MTRVPLRLVWLGTVASLAADAWFAAVACVDRVLAFVPWRVDDERPIGVHTHTFIAETPGRYCVTWKPDGTAEVERP